MGICMGSKYMIISWWDYYFVARDYWGCECFNGICRFGPDSVGLDWERYDEWEEGSRGEWEDRRGFLSF